MTVLLFGLPRVNRPRSRGGGVVAHRVDSRCQRAAGSRRAGPRGSTRQSHAASADVVAEDRPHGVSPGVDGPHFAHPCHGCPSMMILSQDVVPRPACPTATAPSWSSVGSRCPARSRRAPRRHLASWRVQRHRPDRRLQAPLDPVLLPRHPHPREWHRPRPAAEDAK